MSAQRVTVCLFMIGCAAGPSGDPCGDCSLEVVTAATLRADTGEIVLGEGSVGIALGSGFVALNSSGDRLLQFDSIGKLVRIAGRPGNGPGELRSVDMLVSPDPATLWVFQVGRYLVFDSSLAWQRTIVAPGRYCMLSDGRRGFLCLASRGSKGAIVQLDSSGVEVRRFGPSGDLCPTCEGYLLPDAVPGGDELILAALGQGVIERWGMDGELRGRIEYHLPPGAVPTADQTQRGVVFPPHTKLYGGWRDSTGNYFLLLHRPNEPLAAEVKVPLRRIEPYTFVKFAGFGSVVLMIDSSGAVKGYVVFEGERVLPSGLSTISRGQYDDKGMVQVVVETVRAPEGKPPAQLSSRDRCGVLTCD